ncbi:TonB-dependent receptor [Indibacter alkaliphilus LW1]|uniref:TonB-dependent receptor n=1 Tax=Indibacter alkaliphilus (strain CCUG 57479 / KCTC 22604 / LW1) TaxID=1189612 RepID=S2D3C5_INDAL|nr:TonB-dependent receptor [Indibacter alkaliphilus]EOZ91525.1 TonB-dependent receptor [Indibacter alkaliphilus LW1]
MVKSFTKWMLLMLVPLLFLESPVWAQAERTVRGTVTEANGEPLIGVSVVVKGTTKGVVTDIEGAFSLQGVSESATLVFSYIGFKSQEAAVGSRTSFDIVLEEDMSTLGEVVIVGFGEQKKANLTGAVSTISGDILAERPVQNVGQMLQGLIPGLNLQTSGLGGELNQNLSFNIRGTGSIGQGSNSSPLVLIDGMDGDLNALNPQDIENVTVLKDAAAASVYGSRAAFGVILITTKSGKEGKAKVNYNNNFRVSQPRGLPNMMDSHTFARYYNEAAYHAGRAPIFEDDVLNRIVQFQNGEITASTIPDANGARWQYYQQSNANTDWFREQYRDLSFSQEHNVSVNGGNENARYFVSGNFLDQGGLTRHGGDNFQRYSLAAKVDFKLTDKLSFMYNNRLVREAFSKATHLNDLFYHNIARRWPNVPVRDPNGFFSDPSEINQLREGGRVENLRDFNYMQGQLTYTPLPGWNIVASANYRVINTNNNSNVLPSFAYDVEGEPFPLPVFWNAAGHTAVSEFNQKEDFFTSNIYSDYSFNLGDGHSFKAMVGFNSEVNKYRNISASRVGLISPSVISINTATDNFQNAGQYNHWATAGFFGRLNYNYKEKYLVEFNSRYDGTSRFIQDLRWNLFNSFSLGYNLAREGFWTIEDKIQMLKLRGSYGELGNQNTSSWYPFYLTQPFAVNSGAWMVNGIRPNTASAPGLISQFMTWERVRSYNVGLDLGMFRNRLVVNFDYFQRLTLDMVGPAQELPVILGTGVPVVNNADLKAWGFELEASWRDNIGNFNYSIRGVLSDDQMMVTRYPNETGNLDQWYSGRMGGEIWGFETVGIARNQAEMDRHLETTNQNQIGPNWQAGDVMYRDLNGDGAINTGANTLDDPGDRRIIGNSTPRYRFSLDFTGQYKQFDFRVFLQGVGKRDYMPNGPYFWGAGGQNMWQAAGFVEHMDFFRDENSPMVQAGVADVNLDSYFPRPVFDNGKNNWTQTRFLQNAAYMRLKNVQVGYTIPKWMSDKARVANARVYLSGENLLTFTRLSRIFDPESVGLAGWNSGKTYPFATVYSAGLNINF